MHSDWISLVQDLIEARMMAQFQSEVNIMAKIDHLCLVKLIGYIEEGNELILVEVTRYKKEYIFTCTR